MPRGQTYQDYRAELAAMDRELGEIARESRPLPTASGSDIYRTTSDEEQEG